MLNAIENTMSRLSRFRSRLSKATVIAAKALNSADYSNAPQARYEEASSIPRVATSLPFTPETIWNTENAGGAAALNDTDPFSFRCPSVPPSSGTNNQAPSTFPFAMLNVSEDDDETMDMPIGTQVSLSWLLHDEYDSASYPTSMDTQDDFGFMSSWYVSDASPKRSLFSAPTLSDGDSSSQYSAPSPATPDIDTFFADYERHYDDCLYNHDDNEPDMRASLGIVLSESKGKQREDPIDFTDGDDERMSRERREWEWKEREAELRSKVWFEGQGPSRVSSQPYNDIIHYANCSSTSSDSQNHQHRHSHRSVTDTSNQSSKASHLQKVDLHLPIIRLDSSRRLLALKLFSTWHCNIPKRFV